MNYEYIERNRHTLFVLFHGTGGTEKDLIPLVEQLAPNASILALQGDVLENGMRRFFKRKGMGIFDYEDLAVRTSSIEELLKTFLYEQGYKETQVIMLGYSNGANMIASILFMNRFSPKSAILLHPMVPWKDVRPNNLENVNVWISSGVNDPICPKEEAEKLVEILHKAKAKVDISWFSYGHSISQQEIIALHDWYGKNSKTQL